MSEKKIRLRNYRMLTHEEAREIQGYDPWEDVVEYCPNGNTVGCESSGSNWEVI